MTDRERTILWIAGITIATALVVTLLGIIEAQAASFNCGRYMKRATGASEVSKTCPLSRALCWQYKPATSAGPGTVVVQRRKGKASDGKSPGGHVSEIRRMISPCRAIVRDNSGIYERDICKALVAYVRP